jgi:hypothetical protein
MNTIDFVSDPNATEGASPTEGSPWNVQQLGIQVVISAHNAARWCGEVVGGVSLDSDHRRRWERG